jgi:PKD repeat protein
MKRISFAALLLSLILPLASTAQESHLLLRSGNYDVPNVSVKNWSTNEVFENQYFRIVVFNEIPTNAVKEDLHNAGIILYDYLPRNAFYASIATNADWSVLTDATVMEIQPEFKLTEILHEKNYPHWTLFGADQIELIAAYYEPYNASDASEQLSSIGGTLVSNNDAQKTMNVRVPLSQLDALYALPGFYYFETLPDTPQPENLLGRNNHRSNVLYTDYAGGLQYNGEGVNVMMQDDGEIGPHIDYTGRIDQSSCSGCSTNPADDHGDHVSGTIMGAGNLDPEFRGMANGVDLKVYNSSNNNYNLFPSLFDNGDVVITSKSYSNGCNSGYTTLARLLDLQVHDRPQLTHVFSAGNSGGDDCGYGAGNGWGNITGGLIAGKNVIAVGNLTHTDGLSNSSSRGPAEDGRIKPDICAVGSSVTSTGPDNIYFTISGTSMSCPGVSGTFAQLYHGYRDLNGGNNPDAALIKGAVLNTGEDLGNVGPDFRYGWGRINARMAFEVIQNNQYINDNISQGATKQHTITVPAGVSELRVMTYWTDYEGSTSAAIALVNDINMEVIDPNTTVHQPWLLDHTPNATSLNTPATTGVDALNNMEQVAIVDPVSGTYTIDINGFAIPQGPQDYYVVYSFIMDDVVLTYPLGGEGLIPGGNILRWDASEDTTPFDLEYTTDNGGSWNTIGTANADRRYLSWNTPNTITGQAKVRISRNGQTDESPEVFTIMPQPSGLNFEWVCPDSAKIAWNTISGATGYEVSMLGTKYMDSIGTSTTNSYVVQVPSSSTGWYSVRALGPNDARGERAVAIQKPANEFGCLWSPPTSAFDIDCPSAGVGHCFDMIDQSINTSGSSTYTWYFPGGTPATSSSPNPTVCYTAAGTYDVAMVVDNGFGTDSIYTTNAITVLTTPGLPYFEGFENYQNLFSIDEWSTSSPGNATAFLITTQAALSGTKSALLFNYTQQAGLTDELISGPIDLTSLSPGDDFTMSFRYAYRKTQSADNDFLRVSVTEGCEDNWTVRKTLFGDLLSPLIETTSWYPSGESEWTTVHMTNITDNFFTGDFRMKFTFESDGGNNFLLDNINLYEGEPSDDLVVWNVSENAGIADVNVYPVPAADELTVAFGLNASEKTLLTILDITGKKVQTNLIQGKVGSNLAVLDVQHLAPGAYMVAIQTATGSVQKRFVIE